MSAHPSRRPYPGQDYKHGWQPVSPQAVVEKNHGRKPTPGTKAAEKHETVSERADKAIRGMVEQKRSRPAPQQSASKPAPEKPAASAPTGESGSVLRHKTNREGVSWAKKNMPLPNLTDDERSAVDRYTGRGYGLVNEGLRGKPPAHPKHRQLFQETVRELDSAMKKSKTPEAVVVHRDVGDAYLKALGIKDVEDVAQMQAVVGKTFRERGYLSTSVGTKSSNMRGTVDLSITVPKGYPALNVMQMSGFAADERELLLGRGAKYVVREVKKVKGRWAMEIEILPPGRGK